ncbi:MAG: chemotaxis protein CheX, partial [Gammaproteobacteria bacterium]|nr:chemotaxis protein CheX [Gammaproteobacteria bacterium]
FTGTLSGVIYLYTTIQFASRITRGLLGLNPEDPQRDDLVNDAMGEIANMVVGHFKSRLTDRGIACVMTIPSIVRGSHLGIEAVSHTKVKRLSFRTGDHFLLAEILIQTPPSRAA